MKLTLLLFLLSLFCACASITSSPSEDSMPTPLNRMQPDHLPTPFSSELIRESCTAGAFREFHVVSNGMELTQKLTFRQGDDLGAAFHVSLTGADGGEPQESNAPFTLWTKFQSHASYPAAETTVDLATVSVPAGTFDCWLYTQTDQLGTVSETYFAIELPGPPVLSTSRTAEGSEITRLELLSFGK
jgi:hypothetical protein